MVDVYPASNAYIERCNAYGGYSFLAMFLKKFGLEPYTKEFDALKIGYDMNCNVATFKVGENQILKIPFDSYGGAPRDMQQAKFTMWQLQPLREKFKNGQL